MLAMDGTWAGRQLYTGYKLKDYLYTNKYSWYWMNREPSGIAGFGNRIG